MLVWCVQASTLRRTSDFQAAEDGSFSKGASSEDAIVEVVVCRLIDNEMSGNVRKCKITFCEDVQKSSRIQNRQNLQG